MHLCLCALTSLHLSVLDVYVLSTDGQVQDFRFPQTNKGGATLQLSSNTVKVNSKNGKKNANAAETFNYDEAFLHTTGLYP